VVECADAEASAVNTVLLLHAGIADSRMWEPQVEVLEAAGYRMIAPDLRGFGDRPLEPAPFSHVRDAEALLDGPAAVVGCSLGGRVALELLLHRPDLVERLVLIAPGLPGWEWSNETRAGWAAEEAAYESGDVEAAAEAGVRMWVDGPNRSSQEVDAGIRAAVVGMVLRSYEMQEGAWEGGAREDEVLDTPMSGRLDEIRCPTLVLVGEDDVTDMRAIAAHVAEAVANARLVTIAKAAHLPNLERAGEVNALLLAFLSER
jgi:3-oxoadipate enol-lactonase